MNYNHIENIPVPGSSVQEFLANKEKQPREPENGPGPVAVIATLIVIGCAGQQASRATFDLRNAIMHPSPGFSGFFMIN